MTEKSLCVRQSLPIASKAGTAKASSTSAPATPSVKDSEASSDSAREKPVGPEAAHEGDDALVGAGRA